MFDSTKMVLQKSFGAEGAKLTVLTASSLERPRCTLIWVPSESTSITSPMTLGPREGEVPGDESSMRGSSPCVGPRREYHYIDHDS